MEIQKIEKYPRISEVVTIPQVRNLEDELIRSCGLKNITELLNSKSRSEFKSDIIKVSNLSAKSLINGKLVTSFFISAEVISSLIYLKPSFDVKISLLKILYLNFSLAK